MPLPDDSMGIYGIVPPEGLHTFGSESYMMLLDTVNNTVSVGNKNKEIKAEVNGSKRYPENNMLRPMIRYGIIGGTR